MDATLTISDAAAQSGISAHTLRSGMPIRQVRMYAELLNGGDDTNEERLALLEAHREAVQARLDETAGHLDLYRERLGKNEEAQVG